MANQWFKFYGSEYLSDPKMLGLSAIERSCWLTLLCYASLSENNDGKIRGLSEELLLAQSGVRINDTTLKVLSRFVDMKMIQVDTDLIQVLNWEKRQKVYAEGYLRVKHWREKKRVETEKKRQEENRVEENRIEKKDMIILFENFWDLYPNKVAKKKTFTSWINLELTQRLYDKIIESLKAHKESDRWNNGFIPQPTTWINQERWDEILQKAKVEEKKPYYNGDPIVVKNGRRYVIVKSGEWLQYAGKESEIEYK